MNDHDLARFTRIAKKFESVLLYTAALSAGLLLGSIITDLIGRFA